ncbi:MAG: hypothetical protein KGL31_09790 [candidate division NC10 bacterium]|nr:hypothetical protein [candidate division NC10 bacterium]MDE2322188.1 hypothetical protein [candidate division NC10 bacterium]
MMSNNRCNKVWFSAVVALLGILTFTTSSFAAPQAAQCHGSPSRAQLRAALHTAMGALGSGGFGLNMWATVVNRDGVVCAAAFFGEADDPVTEAYGRALEDSGRSADNGQANDPIAESFCKALSNASESGQIGRSKDPIAMAYRRALEDSGGCVIR